MPRYRFTATDAQGQAVGDQIDATDADAARTMLASRQLRVESLEEITPENSPALSALSRKDAEALTAHIADLTQAGLPLESGLKRLADDLPRGQLSQTLSTLAEELDRGASLEEALGRLNDSMPDHLRGLIRAGLRSGRLAEVLGDYAIREQISRDHWRQARIALAYPLLVLLMLAPIMLAFSLYIAPTFAELFTDFDLELPYSTQLVLWLCQWVIPWFLLALVVILISVPLLRWAGGSRIVDACWIAIPFLGTAWNWAALAEFVRLLRLLMVYEIPLPEALSYTSAGMRDSTLRHACGQLRESTAHGHPLSEAVSAQYRFPAGLGPLLAWGEQSGSLLEALEIATTAYEDRVRLQVELLKSVLPPIVFIFVALTAMAGVTAMIMPMVVLVRSFMWWW